MRKLPNRGPTVQVRIIVLVVGVILLATVYIFQRINVAAFVGVNQPNAVFIINRTSRLAVNDFACFLIIYALFLESKYLRVAFWVFLGELILVLPLYFLAKLSLEGPTEISSPLLSQIHRLIVNPVLMILLILGFLYQKFIFRNSRFNRKFD